MNPWPVEAEVPEVHLPRPGHADLVGVVEVRPHRRAQRARARQRPRDRGARRRRRAGQGVPARARRRGPQPRRPDRRRCRAARAPARARGLRRRRRRSRSAAWTPRRAAAMVAHINVPAQGQRVDRRRLRGARVRARARARLARLLGGAPRRPPRRRRSARSRRSRASRSATASTSPPRPGSQAHDEIFYSEERGFYRETNHAGGLEGGMTTGEPLSSSVRDEAAPDADQAAALGRHRDARAGPGAARAHRLVRSSRRPASSARRWSRSCSPTPTGASSAATTSTTCARPSAPTGSGSGGRAAERRLSARPHRLHGRRQDDRRPRGCDRARRRARRRRRAASSSGSGADRGVLRAPRRGGVPRARRSARRSSCSPRRAPATSSRSAAARSLSRARARRAAATRVVLLDVDLRDRVAARAHGRDRPLARDRDAFAALLRRARAALRARSPTRSSPAASAASTRRGAAVAARAAATARRMLWASAARAVPGAGRPRRRWRGDPLAGARPATSSSPTTPSAPLHARAAPATLRRVAIAPGEEHKTLASRRAGLARAGPRRDDPRRPRRRARRRRRRRPRRLLRGDLPARHARRPGADDARRAGRLGLRRQDRRRPARGQELRRRLPPAGRRCSSTLDARDAAAPRSSRPATPRSSRRR